MGFFSSRTSQIERFSSLFFLSKRLVQKTWFPSREMHDGDVMHMTTTTRHVQVHLLGAKVHVATFFFSLFDPGGPGKGGGGPTPSRDTF